MSTQESVNQPVPIQSVVADKALPKRVIVDELSKDQREQEEAFIAVCGYIDNFPQKSERQKIAQFEQLFATNDLPTAVLKSLKTLNKKKTGCPDRTTLSRWLAKFEKYQSGNRLALIKNHKGRQRTVHGWEQKAIELFNLPSKPAYANVAFWLRTDHGFPTASNSAVAAYLKKLPATLGKQSPQRMGKTFYKHNLAPYKIRDNEVLPVGYGYEGDGHTVDVYVAHPNTGNLYRPELTIWIDIRSRMVVGWYLEKSESAISTLFALSEALLAHDHVPAEVFLDNGSGFASRMMADEVTGFFTRLSINASFCLPGNSKGKGLVEGFNRIFRDRHDKKFQTYCGDDMADEINRRLPDMVKRGKRTLPSLAEYAASVRQFIIDYNNEPKPVLDGKKPIDVWTAGLKRVPVHIHADALVQPRELRVVQRWRITLFNRKYEAAELAQYNDTEVMVEYNLHNDAEIRVLDDKQRLICIAKLVHKLPRRPDSHIVERQQISLDASVARQQNKIDEIKQRAKPIITADDSTNALIDLTDDDYSRLEVANTDSDPLDYLYLPTEMKKGADENSSFLDWLDD